MRAKSFTIIISLLLLACGFAQPATASPSIRINASAGVSSEPLQHRYNMRLPQLTGAKPKARKTFATIVSGIIQQELAFLVRWRNRYDPTPQCNNRTENSRLWARTRKGMVAGHYATAAIVVSTWPACGGVDQVNARTINLDTRTGKSLRLDRLIVRVDTYPVVSDYLSYGARAISGKSCDAEMYKRPTLYNWVLKPRGIQFWFDKYKVSAGYCGAVSITIPWRDLPLTSAGERLAAEVR